MVTKPAGDCVTTAETTIPTTITNYNWVKVPSSAQFYKNAWLTEFLGSAFNKPVGFKGAASFVKFKPRGAGPEDDGYINVGISATVNTTTGPKHAQLFGTNKNWAGNGAGIQFTVIDDGQTKGQWPRAISLDQCQFRAATHTRRWSVDGVSRIHCDGVKVTTTPGKEPNASNGERFFELATQVSDCSHYDEVEKSCDSVQNMRSPMSSRR